MEDSKCKMMRTTPDYITSLRQEEIFVFGSNLQGKHCSGAAKIALEKFGAKIGVGFGKQGQSYAIPTMQGSLKSIEVFVHAFLLFVKNNQNKRFFVTPIGCGIAGYTAKEIAPFFIDATEFANVFLPQSFWEVIEKQNRLNKYRDNVPQQIKTLSTNIQTSVVKTSNYSSLSIDIRIHEGLLIVTSGFANAHTSLCIIFKNASGDIIDQKYINGECQYIIPMPCMSKNHYTYIDLYFQKETLSGYYRQLSLPIDYTQNTFIIRNADFYNHNITFYNSIPVDSTFLKKQTMLTAVVPGALIEFRDLANSITRYDNSEYNKILSVHDWIAKNIFYDYDSLNDGSYKNTPLEKTAITALRNRRCVCQGYTDLSVALLRSIGIPAMGICCWAVGECNDDEALNQNRSNHIFTAAFCGGNWMLCDITWDSMNRYENDSYDEDKKVSHTYFDATVQFLSYTHRFVGY